MAAEVRVLSGLLAADRVHQFEDPLGVELSGRELAGHAQLIEQHEACRFDTIFGVARQQPVQFFTWFAQIAMPCQRLPSSRGSAVDEYHLLRTPCAQYG